MAPSRQQPGGNCPLQLVRIINQCFYGLRIGFTSTQPEHCAVSLQTLLHFWVFSARRAILSACFRTFSASGSAQNNAAPDRDKQHALLSLLGTVGGRGEAVPATGPQQVPTPPGSSQSSGPSPNDSNNEAQGKFLLEQLMG
jgi:hypothetical protein